MDHPTCSQLRTQVQEIKELKSEFDFKVANIKTDRNTILIYELEKEVRGRIGAITESLHSFFLEQQMTGAERIMQKDFLGPGAIEATFGFKPEIKDIPFIPFSRAELERAKELGQFLVLRADKTPTGEPLTMKSMNELKRGAKIEWVYEMSSVSPGYFEDDDFYTTDTPSFGWALVSKEIIPSSLRKDYLRQTEEIVNYLEEKVFKDQLMSSEYQEAVNELKQAQEEIKPLIPSNWDQHKIDPLTGANWQLVAEKLERLKINQFFLHTPVEFFYDIFLRQEKTGEYILFQNYIRTKRRVDDHHLVCVRAHESIEDDQIRAEINTSPLYSYFGDLGVLFSRKF